MAKLSGSALDLSWLRCPRCESSNVYFRATDDTYKCRRCGATFVADFESRSTDQLAE